MTVAFLCLVILHKDNFPHNSSLVGCWINKSGEGNNYWYRATIDTSGHFLPKPMLCDISCQLVGGIHTQAIFLRKANKSINNLWLKNRILRNQQKINWNKEHIKFEATAKDSLIHLLDINKIQKHISIIFSV